MNPSSLLLLRRRRLRLPPDRWMLALLAVVLCITALGHAPPASAAGTRLVTIGGAVTETVFALGAGSQVVAVDTSSTYPDAAQQRPKVGYARTLAAKPPRAMRESKRLMRQAAQMDLHDLIDHDLALFAELLQGDEAKAILAAKVGKK